ncbi:heterokaryon incompatibility protein-domain-containing protein [Massariosphaeria phaeospora]|uniref:Heterokaryon incompatibility protein-domain-containing protein n=1 Tax=Massariosphaeria phaeospora TaxID=100035 RepID=A0A7C8MDI8_9PLEO|nr:heterokaryon incompatibility protein-domain-containing protein [Massariosphaeria phaeospora]
MAFPDYQPSTHPGHCEFLEIDNEEVDTSNLHVHVVSPETRQQLLLEQKCWEIDDSAEHLLADLGRLAPSVARSFVKKSSIRDRTVFRLINDADCVEEATGFVALSYCWNTNHNAPKTIVSPVGDLPFGWVRTVEQFPLPTSGSMFQAALGERYESEGLWFDQVCINQEDEAEKAAALGAIDTIYKNARVVIIALDDITASKEEAEFLQQYLRQYASSDLPIEQQPNQGLEPPFLLQHAPFRSFLERVLSSTWFERAWCAHEMRMGRDHVFLIPSVSNEEYGSKRFIRFTGALFFHMLVLANELPIIDSRQQARLRSLLDLFRRKTLTGVQDSFAVRHSTTLSPIPRSTSFISTITDVFAMKAGGDHRLPEYLRKLNANRDKTSIALNASGLPLALAPPSPLHRPHLEDECLRQLLLLALAARDPLALCTTGAPLQLHDGSISWLTRPTLLDLISAHHPLPPFPQPSAPMTQASDASAEYIQLPLTFLSLPHRTHTNAHFPSHLHRARTAINLCIQYQLASHSHSRSHTMWSFWQQSPAATHPRAAAMQNVFVQTLACVFECGPRWVVHMSRQFQDWFGTPVLDARVVDTLLDPHLSLQGYICTPAGRHGVALLVDFLAMLVTHGIPWASGATERTHGPLVVTSPHSLAKALVFAPFAHSKTLLLAVPEVLSGREYAALARGWVLTPLSAWMGSPRGVVSWVLQGKSRVFGEVWLGGDVQGAVPVGERCHRVYGMGSHDRV